MELQYVVVIAEFRACSSYFFPDLIELLRVPAPVVKSKHGFRILIARLPEGWIFEDRGRTDDVTASQIAIGFEDPIQLRSELIVRVMCADVAEPGVLHRLLHLACAVVVEVSPSHTFYFTVAEARKLLQRGIVAGCWQHFP